jgi:hypothetical protein
MTPELRYSRIMARPYGVLAGIVLAVGLIASGATAAVYPKFSRSQARVGQLVTISQPGGLWDSLRTDSRPIRIYLVRANIVGSVIGTGSARKVGPPPANRVRYVGTWSSNGRLTFRLPLIRPGRYAAVAWCLPCGGTLIGSVPSSVPDDAYVRTDGSLLTVLRR